MVLQNIDIATVFRKHNEGARTQATPWTAIVHAHDRWRIKKHQMRRGRRGDPATNITAIKQKTKIATSKSRILTGDKEEAKDDNRRGVQKAAMVQQWYMCDKGV